MSNARGISIPDFKLHCGVIVIKKQYWHTNRHVDKQNRTEDKDINQTTTATWFLTKINIVEKTVPSIISARKLVSTYRRMKILIVHLYKNELQIDQTTSVCGLKLLEEMQSMHFKI